MQNNTQTIPTNVIITSILLAFFVDSKILNLIVLVAFPSLAGIFMTPMYVMLVLGLFYMGIIKQRRSLVGLAIGHKSICFLCIMWYMFTSLFIGEPSVSVPFFAIFMVAAFLIPGIIYIDLRIFLLALLLLPSIGILFLDQIVMNSIREEGILSMPICYALLVPILANLVFLKFFFMGERLWMKFLLLPFTAINIYYLLQMVMFGSRGPFLCVFLLFFSFFLVKKVDSELIILRKDRLVILIIVIIFLILFFIPILQALSDYFSSLGISLNVVDKFLRMEDSGDMSNGRNAINKIAMDSIWQSPFWGYGIAQFERNTGIVYPHNFIIQMFYDGGLVLATCVFIPIIVSIKNRIHLLHKNEFICLLFFFFASVPGSLFSGDLWQAYRLWLLGGFIFSTKTILK